MPVWNNGALSFEAVTMNEAYFMPVYAILLNNNKMYGLLEIKHSLSKLHLVNNKKKEYKIQVCVLSVISVICGCLNSSHKGLL